MNKPEETLNTCWCGKQWNAHGVQLNTEQTRVMDLMAEALEWLDRVWTLIYVEGGQDSSAILTVRKALSATDGLAEVIELMNSMAVLENGTANVDGVDLTLDEMFDDIKNLVNIYVEPKEELSNYYYGIIIVLKNMLRDYNRAQQALTKLKEMKVRDEENYNRHMG